MVTATINKHVHILCN